MAKEISPLQKFINAVDRIFGKTAGDCENCKLKGQGQKICDICVVIAEALDEVDEEK
jgi:hypothetical protein